MSEATRYLRNETRNAIEEERKKAREELERLQREHENKIRQMQADQQRQLNDYHRQLEDLRREQENRFQTTGRHIDEELARQEERVRRQIENLKIAAQQRIEEQERRFEQQKAELYRIINQRIEEVMRRIDAIHENERSLAEDSVNAARAAYRSASEDPAVKAFEAVRSLPMLTRMVNECIGAFNDRRFAAATGKALIAEIECKRCMADASMAREAWQKRTAVVASKYRQLKESLGELEKEDFEVTEAEATWSGSLKAWAGAEYEALRQMLNSSADRIRGIQPGDYPSVDAMDITLTDMIGRREIQRVRDKWTDMVRSYLYLYRLLSALEAILPDWSETEGEEMTLEEIACTGHVELSSGDGEYLQANAFLVREALEKTGKILLTLQLAYGGTRRDEELERSLLEIVDDLQQEINQSEYGYMRFERKHDVGRNRQGYPMLVLEISPERTAAPAGRKPAGREKPEKTAEHAAQEQTDYSRRESERRTKQ